MVYPSGDMRSVSITLHAQVNVIMRLLLLMPRIKMLLRYERTQEVLQRHTKHWLSWLLSSMTAGSQPHSRLQYNTQLHTPWHVLHQIRGGNVSWTDGESVTILRHQKATSFSFWGYPVRACDIGTCLGGQKKKSLSICYCIFCHMA